MRHIFPILILLFFISQSDAFRRQKEYCSLLAKCNMKIKEGYCTLDTLKSGIRGVEYTLDRCREAINLKMEGVNTDDALGKSVYGFLGQKYRVIYEISDSLPIGEAPFEFLLQDIPLAANVVNTFRGTKYTARYLDGDRKRYWKGNNGKNLFGEAELISGDVEKDFLTYFGVGIVKILKWKLRGKVLFKFKYKKTQSGKIAYDLKITVFPSGGFVNAIMSMGVFRNVVHKKIKEVFTDISTSAQDLQKTPYEEILKKYKWKEAEKAKLKTLTSLK